MFAKKMCVVCVLLVACFGCVGEIVVDEGLIVKSVKTLAEYGSYFGLKKGNVDDQKAKIAEESIRVAINVLKAESINDLVDINKALDKLSPSIKEAIVPVLNKIDGKYVELKGKIPADKVKYIMGILEGAFDGVEEYRKYLAEATEEVKSLSINKYESNLIKEAVKAEQVIK